MRQDKGNGLASTDHEFTDCFEIFSVEIARGPQDQTLRTGNRVDGAVLSPGDPWYGRPGVEAHHSLSTKGVQACRACRDLGASPCVSAFEAEAFDQFVGEVCLVRAPERGAGIGNGGIRLVALAEHGIGALSKVQDA